MLRFVCGAALVLGLVCVLLAAWTLREVLLALFAALVLANGMSSAANWVKLKLRLRYALALALVVTWAVAGLSVVLWFFGSTIFEQVDELRQRIPAGAQWIKSEIQARSYLRELLSNFDFTDLSGTTGSLAAALAPKVKSVASVIGSMVVAAIVSVYFAAQPHRYRSGLLLLVPPPGLARAERLFDAISGTLARWILGQLVVMATVGVLSGLGLWILGVRAALVLGLTGGLLSFIPFFGSLVTAVSAALFALGQGPTYALAVLAMYVAVHFIEGNFITPIVQSEATSLPPALALVSVISWTMLLGAPAAFLAVPLTLVILAAINVLYVEPLRSAPARQDK